MTYDVTTFTPQGGALALASRDYSVFLSQFKRAAEVVLNSSGAIEPDLDVRDIVAIRNVTEFLKWMSSVGMDAWQKGVPLNKAAIQAACGQPAHLGYAALRACLVKVKSGNRKKGESDTWTISLPNIRGLGIFLARNAAQQAAFAAHEIEATERRVVMESELDAVLSADPHEAQYQKDYEWTQQRWLEQQGTPQETRVSGHLALLNRDSIKLNVGTRDNEPFHLPIETKNG